MRRSPLHAVLNITGLAVGLASCALIALFIHSETGFDTAHPAADRLYRVSVVEVDASGTQALERALVSPAVTAAMAEQIPQIEAFGRMTPVGPLLSVDDTHIAPDNTFWADPSILELFAFDWLSGSGEGALESPNGMVISESVSRQLFGTVQSAGETVLINDEEPFIVQGVFRDFPYKTHVRIDVLGPIQVLERWFGMRLDETWDSANYASYVRLTPGSSLASVTGQLDRFMERTGGRNAPTRADIRLQPVGDIHLHSHVVAELQPQGSLETIKLLGLIAGLILLIASVNYVNLAFASAARRARTVGLRKVSGATRSQLLVHYLIESVFTTLLAIMLAGILVAAGRSAFESFVGHSLGVAAIGWPVLLTIAGGIVLVLGLLAGLYPAMFLSGLHPADLFRSGNTPGTGRMQVRRALVIGQFALASGMLFATMVIFAQLRFMTSSDPGHDVEGIVIMPPIRELAEDFEPFRQRVESHPDISAVTHAFRPPLAPLMVVSDGTLISDDGTSTAQLYPMWSDYRFIPVYGLDVVAGRNFDPDRESDRSESFILNETAVSRFGLSSVEAAVGATLQYGGREGRVIGVIKDYHQESMHAPIPPMVLFPRPDNYRHIGVRFRSADVQALMAFLREAWQPYEGNYPWQPRFLDQQFEAAYRAERRLATLFTIGALLGGLVACLGLFGIASATVQRRIREVGIRKALGASRGSLMVTIGGRFLMTTGFAAVLGSLAAWIWMGRWLETYAFRISPGWEPWAGVIIASLLMAALAVALHTIRASGINPVEALRHTA